MLHLSTFSLPKFNFRFLYNYILLLFHLNFSWTLWAVNNAHASFVWKRQLKRASFPGISLRNASHNGQCWYFNDYP